MKRLPLVCLAFRYDVGRINPDSGYARGFPAQAALDGTRIPRLAQVFALARRAGNGQVRFNIETKLTPGAPDETLPPEPFARKVAEAKSLGIAVVVWTVNDPAAIAAMMDMGVSGIISDQPDLVREEMRKRAMALRPATAVAP